MSEQQPTPPQEGSSIDPNDPRKGDKGVEPVRVSGGDESASGAGGVGVQRPVADPAGDKGSCGS